MTSHSLKCPWRFIENKDTLRYVKDMRGWYIQMYKDDKLLYTSIIVVFFNDNSEYDRGNPNNN